MKSLDKKLLRNVWQLKTQIFSIAILIICGLSVFVSSWSSYLSLKVAQEQFYEHYRFADVFASIARAPRDLIPKIQKLEGIEKIDARIVTTGILDLPHQNEPATAQLITTTNQESALNKIYLRQGHLPSENSWEIVVHESFAVAHKLKPGDRLALSIKGQKYTFVVSGIGISPEYIFVLGAGSPLPDDKHFGVFWVHESTLSPLVKMQGAFNNLLLRVAKAQSTQEAIAQLDTLLKPYGSLGSYSRSKQMSHMFLEDEIRQQKVMAFIIPLIFMSVAAFILNIILARIVNLQRGQIGMLKAIGYSNKQIFIHFYKLVTLILTLGIVPAIIAGHYIGQWYAQLYQEYYRFPSIDFNLSFEPIFFGILAGLIPGWLGSWQSLKKIIDLAPMEALRPPPPSNFREGILDKFGVTQRLDSQSKIVMRNLIHKPLRLLLNMVGIAAAIAIIVNGNFWNDIIDYMLNQQFYKMTREDVAVSFANPLRLNALQELRNFNGVLFVEGSRTVGVRAFLGHAKKNTAIIGIEHGQQLRRILNQSGEIIMPPAGGILLSRFFELEYKLKVGELLPLELIEGSQLKFSVPIAGFVDDLMGAAIYANKRDLHQWIREDICFDSAHMLVDPASISKIYYELKQRPLIAGVSVKKLLMKSFLDNTAKMLLTFTGILVVFAMAIAGAILYNSMRISFSERSWELASLQILGFTTSQSFLLLFYEIALQLIVSIIPGLGLGYYLSKLSVESIHNESFTFPLVIDFKTYALGGIIMILTLFLSSVSIYFRVKNLNFSEALKARE